MPPASRPLAWSTLVAAVLVACGQAGRGDGNPADPVAGNSSGAAAGTAPSGGAPSGGAPSGGGPDGDAAGNSSSRAGSPDVTAGGSGSSGSLNGGGGAASGAGAGGTAVSGSASGGSIGGSATAGGAGGGSAGSSAGLSFVPVEGVTSVALSVAPDGVTFPMKLHNGTVANASITALSVAMGDAFKLEQPPTLPRDLGAGQDLELLLRFAPKATATATFEAKLSAASAAGSPSTGLFGLAMDAQNTEASLAQVVQTLGYKLNVGGTSTTLGTGSGSIGDEVAASRFVKAGTLPVQFQVVARYSPFEAAPYGYYTGTAGNVTRTQLGVMSRGPSDNVANRTLLPPLDAGAMGSFDPGTQAFGIFAESASNASSLGADARFYQEDALNDDQGGVQPVHRLRVYPLKNRSGVAISNSFLIGCEEASNSDYQDYVFVVSNVSIAP